MQIKTKFTGESFGMADPNVKLIEVNMADATFESAAVLKVIINDFDDLRIDFKLMISRSEAVVSPNLL